MKKEDGVSKYKLNKIAAESLRNSVRLHFDAMILYKNESFPSAFQLSVLSMEELSKAEWIDHYIWTSETNEGYMKEEHEEEWFKLLYIHSKKQWNFVARDPWDFSPKFISQVKERVLEDKKLDAIYVGLKRSKGKIDKSSRISTPWKITEKDARQVISIINSELLKVCYRIEEDGWCYEGGKGMDEVFDYQIFKKLLKWPHKSGIKNKGWRKRNKRINGVRLDWFNGKGINRV